MASFVHIPGIELGDELGHGAFSAVFRGRIGQSPCAVKLPLVRGRWMRWVYREGVALARVHHPNLPAVLEVGEADGLPYIVMELVEGETLDHRLQRGALTRHETLDVAMHLAAALRAVHAVRLVHRDVKPRNVVLGRDGGVRLVDFGFATPLERAIREQAGTRGFAAPEQFRLNARVDCRADLYSLGRVLMACTRSPNGPHEGSPFAAIISGLVEEDPDHRYPDASALLQDLEALQRGDRVLGPAAYTPELSLLPMIGRNPELDRLNRAWMTLGASGSVVLVRGSRGAGKTRLLEACITGARNAGRCRVVDVACRESDPPLATLRRLVEACVATMPGGSAAEREQSQQLLRNAVGEQLQPFAQLIAPAVAEVLGVEAGRAEAAPGGFAEGAAELLARLAMAAGPLLICIDDIQWIDPVSRDAVVRLADRIVTTPAALVLAARSDASLPAIDDFVERSRSPRIDLAPLDEAQADALILSSLGATSVDPLVRRRIVAMADATPLGVLEVLGAFLDTGALRPRAGGWHFDLGRAEHIALPAGALTLLGRRLAELPPATRRVLEAAAVIGTTFDDELLARIVGLDLQDLGFALTDALQAGLIEPTELGSHRLVHESLRETLIAGLEASSRRALHHLTAQALDDRDPSFETVCASARHYAAGEPERSGGRPYVTARMAADAALARFDNETALSFLDLARRAVRAAGLDLDVDFFRSEGEAYLRLGALTESRAAFDAALDHAADPQVRAAILGRVAWVEQARADPEQSWAALARAFSALGASMPVESPGSAALTLGHVVRAELARRRPPSAARVDRARTELLCELHYQNARLGLESGKPLRFVQSTLEAMGLSARLGPSRSQARARASYGVVLSALGRHLAGEREIIAAKRMATGLGDTITAAFCLQLQAVAVSAAGDFERGLALFHDCVAVHGPWLELNEYCLDAGTADTIESLRGRPREALAWNTRAVERHQRAQRTTPETAEYLIHRRRAALASLGRPAENDAWLSRRPAVTTSKRPSFHRTMSWGPRARLLLETDQLGETFEELVREFDAEHRRGRSIHPMEMEYYVCVGHARLNQCLRAHPSSRKSLVGKLAKAVVELRKNAKAPLAQAHGLFLEGSHAWLTGDSDAARRALAKAEAIAERERAPWVVSSIARVRGHMLKEEGRAEASRDLAGLSLLIAMQSGAEPHARWVREEFSLSVPAGAREAVSSSSSTSSRLRRQLASLLHVIRRPSVDVQPSDQAARILDDLLHDLGAEQGVLWFLAEPGVRDELVVGRTARGEAWSVGASGLSASEDDRTLYVPLVLHETTVGGVRIERTPNSHPFRSADHELLLVLSHQIPVSFEVGRLLAEREQLERSLQYAQKMEAVGQLAGGVAHDFNNMLAAIQGSLEVLRGHAGLDGEASGEVATIASSIRRASELTGQLLSFSRHQPVPLSACHLNDVILQMEPILRRLLGDKIRFDLDLGEALHVVDTVQGPFEQVMVNLVVNARDAMPAGGTLRIATRNVFLDASAVRRGAPRTGEHAVITVTDTGRGMPPEVVPRIFDPFFTTKPRGKGTGLGLTTAYAFIKKCGGHIAVETVVDRGTTFTVYLPASAAPVLEVRPERPAVASSHSDSSTILVVDDDFGVRTSIEKVLRRAGYCVLVAADATEAVDLVKKHGPEISLAILDMMMPGMSGAELGRHLEELELRAPVLFVSGYAPDTLPVHHEHHADHFLQKPFDLSELLSRVRHLLDAAA